MYAQAININFHVTGPSHTRHALVTQPYPAPFHVNGSRSHPIITQHEITTETVLPSIQKNTKLPAHEHVAIRYQFTATIAILRKLHAEAIRARTRHNTTPIHSNRRNALQITLSLLPKQKPH